MPKPFTWIINPHNSTGKLSYYYCIFQMRVCSTGGKSKLPVTTQGVRGCLDAYRHPTPNSKHRQAVTVTQIQPKPWDIQGTGSKLGSGRYSLWGFWLSMWASFCIICLVLVICLVQGGERTNHDSKTGESQRQKRKEASEDCQQNHCLLYLPTSSFIVHSVMLFEYLTAARHYSGHICLSGGSKCYRGPETR